MLLSLQRFTATLLLLFICCTTASAAGFSKWNRDSWAKLKYDLSGNKAEKTEVVRNYLHDSAKPRNHHEKIWYFMTQSTLASLVGGLEAVSILIDAKEDIEPELLALYDAQIADDDFMTFAVLSYLYSEVPGWPIGFGSKKKAKFWLKKAHKKENLPDVAFYIARTYHNLKNDSQAKYFAHIALEGFEKKKSHPYNRGKIEEIKAFKFLNK